jgi:hypothetical protein
MECAADATRVYTRHMCVQRGDTVKLPEHLVTPTVPLGEGNLATGTPTKAGGGMVTIRLDRGNRQPSPTG